MLSYNPLWKTLIDKNMKKMDLKELAGISNTTLAETWKEWPCKHRDYLQDL